MKVFSRLIETVGARRIGFNDFRSNGLLLPATEQATLRTGMPLHRGPHPRYNEVVVARVGSIEAHWSSAHRFNRQQAGRDALFRLKLLQRALRNRLLRSKQRMILNRKDPLGQNLDFAELDAMAEAIWQSS